MCLWPQCCLQYWPIMRARTLVSNIWDWTPIWACDLIIGASLSEPQIDHDDALPPRGIMLSMLVSIYVSFTSPLLHHGSWDPCTPQNATCIPVYWRAHMHDLQLHSTEQHGQLELLIVCHKGYWWIQVCQVNNVQTHGLNGFSLLRHWSCSCLATYQHTCVNQKWLIGCRTILLFCDVHWHRCNTELTTVPVCYLCL